MRGVLPLDLLDLIQTASDKERVSELELLVRQGRFMEAVEVELPHKAREVPVLEVLGQELASKPMFVFNDEAEAVFGPAQDGSVLLLLQHLVQLGHERRELVLTHPRLRSSVAAQAAGLEDWSARVLGSQCTQQRALPQTGVQNYQGVVRGTRVGQHPKNHVPKQVFRGQERIVGFRSQLVKHNA